MAKEWMLPFSVNHLGTKFGVKDAAHPNGHRGADFNKIKPGTALPAVSNGTIALKQWSDILGNVVVLKVSRGLLKPVYFGYCHMKNESHLKVGAKVLVGESVGNLGNTGSASSGDHLHLTAGYTKTSVFAGKVFDPVKFILTRLKEIK